MPQILSAFIRFIALLVGVLLAYVGVESPLERWTDPEVFEQIQEDAQTEYDKIIDSQSGTATTTALLDAIKPDDHSMLLEDIVGTSTPLFPVEKATTTITQIIPVPKPIVPKPAPVPVVIPTPVIIPTPAPIVEEPVIEEAPEDSRPETFEEFITPDKNKDLHDPYSAVVRISCTKANGAATELLSGSGVIISPRGYVLTNAHVGYFFSNDEYDCIITETANATIGYKGIIKFISQSWLDDFEDDVVAGVLPASTGEHDIAVVQLNESINPAILLPDEFPHIEVSECTARVGDDITTWGYPGTRTGNILDDLRNSLVTDETSIKATYSFAGGNVDVIETGETRTARQGSSGGAFLFEDGTLAGIIATTLNRDGDDVLTGLSMDYITRLLSEEGSRLARYAVTADCE
jgi:hypothetical protein